VGGCARVKLNIQTKSSPLRKSAERFLKLARGIDSGQFYGLPTLQTDGLPSPRLVGHTRLCSKEGRYGESFWVHRIQSREEIRC